MVGRVGDRVRLALLTVVMATVVAAGVVFAVGVLYRVGFEAQRSALVELVESQVSLIESVARFDSLFSEEDNPRGAVGATMDQVLAARVDYRGFGETGEFVLAQRVDSLIRYVAGVRFGEEGFRQSLPWDSDLAEPMRWALRGSTSSGVGIDYRGRKVLAAHTLIPFLQLGAVAKIDLTEIRAPYLKAGALSAAGAFLLVLLGALLTHRIALPWVTRLEASLKQLDEAQRIAGLGSWTLDIQRGAMSWSEEACRILGYDCRQLVPSEETLRACVHPDDRETFEREMNKSRQDGSPYDIEHRIQRPDGQIRIVEAKGELSRDSRGTPILMRGTIHDITERREAEGLVSVALEEKDALLREVHHRVKNNMQVIVSLLRLHARRIDSPEIQGIFGDCQNRIMAMALVHEALYQSESLAWIDFERYLKKLCRNLSQSHPSHEYKVEVRSEPAGICLEMDTAVTVGMIVSELVSNAFVHAFPKREHGTVRVVIRSNEKEEMELSVTDDGVGLPSSFDLAEATSLGLTLVRNAVVTELDGSIEIKQQSGTRFNIRFPHRES